MKCFIATAFQPYLDDAIRNVQEKLEGLELKETYGLGLCWYKYNGRKITPQKKNK
jgi:hypothetical protein